MRVRYTVPAAAELRSILHHIQDRSPQGARRVLARITDLEALIRDFPEIGRPVGRGLRRLAVTPFPYVLFYECDGDTVIVHRIRHAARKPLI